MDPGVGSNRAAVAVEAGERWYVGPDNGLFSQIVRRADSASAFEITWRPETLSNSFHGRDLFAPVCGMLASTGQVPGRCIDLRALRSPDWPEDLHELVYLDHYGNAMTGLRAARLAPSARIEIAGVDCAYRRTFSDAAPDTPFWYANANGLVEIAAAGASAASLLHLAVGQSFTTTTR